MKTFRYTLFSIFIFLGSAAVAGVTEQLAAEFQTGRTYDLRTTRVPSVVKLREWVKIPPPDSPVYVKVYPSTDAMPPFVRATFTRPNTRGVTILGSYIALLDSPHYPQEVQDVLSHEMVHAYLSLASPGKLPDSFHEGAAVYFSTGKERKFYGREAGVPEGKETVLPEDYKNRLFLFHYLEEKVGREKLLEWIRHTVKTGKVDMSLVGFGSAVADHPQVEKPVFPVVLAVGGGVLLITAIIAGSWLLARKWDNY